MKKNLTMQFLPRFFVQKYKSCVKLTKIEVAAQSLWRNTNNCLQINTKLKALKPHNNKIKSTLKVQKAILGSDDQKRY